MPSAVSILKKPAFETCPVWLAVVELPDNAMTGDTFDARLAGDCAASNTVTTPRRIPQRIPIILTPKSGMSENSPPTRKRNAPHKPHVATTPSSTPMGTAVLHQFSASNRTNRMICRRLIPMHRIMPKNSVRRATVLFILLEIMRTPASRINRNSMAAAPNKVCAMVLL